MVAADRNLKLPRTYQWNVALEKALGSSQSASLTYIGTTGRDLLRVTDLVNPNPDFQFVGVTDNSATSDYHALQVRFQRRLSHGLQALGSYTFSHSIDIASTDAFATYFNLTRAILCCKNEQKMRESQSRCEKTEGGDDSAVSPAG
jgi:hypothetical protein